MNSVLCNWLRLAISRLAHRLTLIAIIRLLSILLLLRIGLLRRVNRLLALWIRSVVGIRLHIRLCCVLRCLVLRSGVLRPSLLCQQAPLRHWRKHQQHPQRHESMARPE